MKIRVGYGLGNLRPLSGDALGALAEGLEGHGFDSLWLSERISGPAPDPVLALTFTAARTRRIKVGTSVSVLPGRSREVRREIIAARLVNEERQRANRCARLDLRQRLEKRRGRSRRRKTALGLQSGGH